MDEFKVKLVQDVIDRLLYLNEKDMDKYIESLTLISSIFQIEIEMDGHVRVYGVCKEKENDDIF